MIRDLIKNLYIIKIECYMKEFNLFGYFINEQFMIEE